MPAVSASAAAAPQSPSATTPCRAARNADREVVGDDGALEAPDLAQQLGEQARVGRRRHAVDVGVRVHHRAHAALADRHLERRQQHVRQLARTHRHGRQVAARLGGRVAHEVLERRDDARALDALDVGGRDGADQVRVFADGLLDAAPARIAHHVEHRGEALVHAHRAHVGADARRRSRARARGRRWHPTTAAPGRRWRPRWRSPRGTPRGRAPGCRSGFARRSAPGCAAARAHPGRGRRARCRTGGSADRCPPAAGRR